MYVDIYKLMAGPKYPGNTSEFTSAKHTCICVSFGEHAPFNFSYYIFEAPKLEMSLSFI